MIKVDESKRIIDRFNEIQLEILRIGFNGIIDKYHPDTNIDHPDAYKVFQLYKEIYANMQMHLVIKDGGENDA